MKRVLALICARSGSKGLRDKNIRPFNGKPLLVHAIERALATRRRGEAWRVVVSTDSPKYAALARALHQRGVLVHPSNIELWFVSTVHTDADIDATLAAFDDAVAATRSTLLARDEGAA